MKRWSSRQFIAFFLGVFLALGMSLSAVQASEMAVQMAIAGDADMSGQGGCDGCGCGGSGDDSADAVTCAPVLNCSGMAALLPAAGGLAVTQTTEQVTPVSDVAVDLTTPPDPYPPRSLKLS